MTVRRSRAVREIRATLDAGVLTEIRPPIGFTRCVVQNGTTADVQIHTSDDLTEYRALAAGFERTIPTAAYYRHDEAAFWLLSTPGGLVILEWS